jgi:hypothetical protein
MGEIIDRMSGKARQIEGALTGSRWRQVQGLFEEAKGNLKGALHQITAALRNLPAKARASFAKKPL